jgi:hypothetical protein
MWWQGRPVGVPHPSAATGDQAWGGAAIAPLPISALRSRHRPLIWRVVGCKCGVGMPLGRPAFPSSQPCHGPERLERGLHRFDLGTLLGYPYSWLAVGAILTTAVLGLIVSLSTFLVIGATSSVTFNVVCDQTLP